MSNNDEKKFAIFMAMLATAFDGKGVSKEKTGLYFEFLKEVSIELIEKAVKELIKTRKYPTFPTVAEIREAAIGGDGQAEEEALAAWSQATRLISAGRRSSDERINEVVKLAFGSWARFGETDPDMEAADRKHFIRCFVALARKDREYYALTGGDEIRRLTGGER